MAINRISHITVFVDDQQAACDWYVDKLGFAVVMDNRDVVPNLRWLTVAPEGNPDTQIVLQLAHSNDEKSRVGSNLMTVLHSDDCEIEMKTLEEQGVEIVDPPQEVPWGVSGIIRDLYGNPYNLVGPKQ
ncbi:MAG TPA: glyoxalase [Gammaproteobacteria bacterium]|jgi:catechol 2,3-dioxygenase-like lactoylglutathione lyase family enzyme|nr:VOC family protein [Gammaproteobacteria bacterium]HAJ75447.1 glyoxalase [Gammaproteobacteria bacterium]|tara:strand:+ start:310 stop:696 length:387 start_codon:yes stop_codon:yes gene_type:complete